jgi:hypothetical protein
VVDPAKNLPGYTGKLPVVVWCNFAMAIPLTHRLQPAADE